jgi:cell wall-associated NlpC family hydrolase
MQGTLPGDVAFFTAADVGGPRRHRTVPGMAIRHRHPRLFAAPSKQKWWLAAAALVVAISVVATTAPVAAQTAPPPPPATADEALTARRALVPKVRQARDEWRRTVAVRDARARELGAAGQALRLARSDYDRARGNAGRFAVELYVRSGDSTETVLPLTAEDLRNKQSITNASMTVELSIESAADGVRDAVDDQRAARRRFDDAELAMADARTRYDAAEAEIATADAQLRRFLDDARVDFSPVAFDAYRTAQDLTGLFNPTCRLSGALLAAVSRIESGHGRTPDALGDPATPIFDALPAVFVADTDGGLIDELADGDLGVGPLQLSPTVWSAHAADGNSDGVRDPQNLFDAALAAAGHLCSFGDLSTWPALSASVAGGGDATYQRTVTVSARRYAAAVGLGLGSVPFDPTRPDPAADPAFSANPRLADRDMAAMLDYARSRIGTPYSQCLGPDVRPQDPICPPGTNRFGAEFFDCSGFVSALYRTIGISIPLTTYAMGADPTFMATQVADRADVGAMEPGDLLLMDGHVAMYAGAGAIIHASSGGVKLERLPGWVAVGTYAVLRPILL